LTLSQFFFNFQAIHSFCLQLKPLAKTAVYAAPVFKFCCMLYCYIDFFENPPWNCGTWSEFSFRLWNSRLTVHSAKLEI